MILDSIDNIEDYKYRYEVHMHNCVASKCGKTAPADYISEYKRLGYTGIIMTDHFYHGNTAIDRDLPWEDFVEGFCAGYEQAKEEGDRQGFDVFFAWEENFHGDEYLIYGPDKAWLKAHPEIITSTQAEQLELIHSAGGVVVQAHPFRERAYIDTVNLHPYQCDAIEACNYSNHEYEDILAYHFCRKWGIKMTSGSDIHDVANSAQSQAGMLFKKPLKSIWDYVEAIKTGKGYIPMIPDDRKAPWNPDIRNTLPIRLFDRNNESERVELEEAFFKR